MTGQTAMYSGAMQSHRSMKVVGVILIFVVVLHTVCAVNKDGSDMKPRQPLPVDDVTVQKAAKVGPVELALAIPIDMHFFVASSPWMSCVSSLTVAFSKRLC